VAHVRLESGGPAAVGFIYVRHAHEVRAAIACNMALSATLSIDCANFALRSSPMDDGGFDLTLDGIKSHSSPASKPLELALRTRSPVSTGIGSIPSAAMMKSSRRRTNRGAAAGHRVHALAEVGPRWRRGRPFLTLEVMKMEQTPACAIRRRA